MHWLLTAVENGGVFTRPCSQTTGFRCSFSSTGSIYRIRYVGNVRLFSPLMAVRVRAYRSPSTPAGPCLRPGTKVVPRGRTLPAMESAAPPPFLEVPEAEWVCANDLCFAIFDSFLLSPGASVIERFPGPRKPGCFRVGRGRGCATSSAQTQSLISRSPQHLTPSLGFHSGIRWWVLWICGRALAHPNIHKTNHRLGDEGGSRACV